MRVAAASAARHVPGLPGLLRRMARRAAGRWYVSATAVVMPDAGRVLLAEHLLRSPAWALPGGWVRAGEDPGDAVAREVREETGLHVEAVAVVGCERHGDDVTARRYAGMTVAYLCRLVAGAAPVFVASAEVSAIRWVDVGEVGAWVTPFERDAVLAAATLLDADGGSQVRRPAEGPRSPGAGPASSA